MAQQGGESFRVIDRRRVRPDAEATAEAPGDPRSTGGAAATSAATPADQPGAPEPGPPPAPGDATRAGPGRPRPAAGGAEAAAAPPPTFPTLVQMLALNALDALGAVAGAGRAEPDLALARHCVDLLGMLEEKCRGNLSETESRFLEQTLFDLRMLVVRAAGGPRA